MYKITYSDRFKKSYKKLSKTEQQQLKNKVALLCENPMHPSLRTKKIKGTEKIFESSVNMSIRLIWKFDGAAIILMLDTGHHDILKQF